mmetsp:Transcript_33680/g.24342  ORF Transcript_33680/g.24342 Transcript_33680/m.24342 type:complete len:109 (+) Transcript_33680:280-606(+)
MLFLDGELLLTSIDKVEGEAEIIVVRNKRKIGCDLSMTLKLEGQGQYEDSHVKVDFNEFGNDGCDPEFEITAEGDRAKELKDAYNKAKITDSLVKSILASLTKYRDQC